MAKRKKKKSGFHKDISSVLKDVPIPQGVRNWRPPDTEDVDRTDDSFSPSLSRISSVFKYVSAELDSGECSSANPRPENHNAASSSAKKTDDQPTSRSSLIAKLDSTEGSLTERGQSGKSESPNRVVRYRDPLTETAVPSVEEQLRNKFGISQKALGNKRRRALVLSAPVLIIIIILIHRYCFRSAPQESEASAGSVPPAISKPKATKPSISTIEARNDVNWEVPELLPAEVMDYLKDPEETPEQKTQKKEPAKGKNKLDLKAILFSDQKPSAIIDGQILYIGDEVNEATITNITKNSVEFKKDGKTWTQKLRK